LVYNLACVRAGVIPPPDIEIKVLWDAEYLDEISWEGSSFVEGTLKEHYRRWFFGNGWGLTVTFHAISAAFPGTGASQMDIEAGHYDVESLLFQYDNKWRTYEEAGWPKRRNATTLAWPLRGIPNSKYKGTPSKSLMLDRDFLLMRLQEAASKPVQHEAFRRNPDDELRKLERIASLTGSVDDMANYDAAASRSGLRITLDARKFKSTLNQREDQHNYGLYPGTLIQFPAPEWLKQMLGKSPPAGVVDRGLLDIWGRIVEFDHYGQWEQHSEVWVSLPGTDKSFRTHTVYHWKQLPPWAKHCAE